MSYDCSDGPWGTPTLKKKSQNLCGLDISPSEAERYIFTSGSCLAADNFYPDVCSKKCATKCDIYSTSCDRVCCIRRDRKTCYTTAENYSGE